MGGILEELGMLGRGLMRGSKSGNVPRLLAREAESGLATRFAPPPATAPMAAPVAPTGIRVYHGSPHSFDTFSMDKIGTGEGGEAFGHGLNFAASEDAAKNFYKPGGGAMYEVNLNADPGDFIDWHKPLSEQSPRTVAKVLDALGVTDKAGRDFAMTATGEQLYDALSRRFGSNRAASEFLRDKAGIPGHVFNSVRDAGGTGYVVFDPKIIEVVKKFGIAGALGAGLITQEMADQMRAQGVPDSVSHKTSPAGPSAMPNPQRFGG